MDYLPIFAKLDARPCVVVGGGDVAWRKISILIKAGAAVTVIAPAVNDNVQKAALAGELVWLKAEFSPKHLRSTFLVIAATNNPLINARVSSAANAQQTLVNVVDDTPKCSFIFPSIVDRSPIVIAISSAGKAPVLARMLREKLETLIPFHFGRMATLAGQFRGSLKQKLTSLAARRKFWETAFDGRFNSLVAAGDEDSAKAELERLTREISLSGEVALIGAGPGDPSLLTLRALQLMQKADVVLYDCLVSEDIIALCRRDATLICVGKRAGYQHFSQEQINALLVKHAQKGKRVARLKGGDPFMFGRGGEELQTLEQSGIPFQVVPGITAAAGATAYAGIPLTHRDHAQAAIFITGHFKKEEDSFRWSNLARDRQTVVIYMGLMKSAYIQEQLIQHGRDPKTPIAIIENGTLPNQKVYKGELSELGVLSEGVGSPALIVVGEVVQLASQLSWFGRHSFHLSNKIKHVPCLI